MMTHEQAQVKVATAYTTDFGGKNAGAIPWAQIIQILLSLFGAGCPTPAVKRLVRRFPTHYEALLSEKLKHEVEAKTLTLPTTHDIGLISKAGMEALTTSTSAEIDSLRRG